MNLLFINKIPTSQFFSILFIHYIFLAFYLDISYIVHDLFTIGLWT